jgi:hypothetical protein
MSSRIAFLGRARFQYADRHWQDRRPQPSRGLNSLPYRFALGPENAWNDVQPGTTHATSRRAGNERAGAASGVSGPSTVRTGRSVRSVCHWRYVLSSNASNGIRNSRRCRLVRRRSRGAALETFAICRYSRQMGDGGRSSGKPRHAAVRLSENEAQLLRALRDKGSPEGSVDPTTPASSTLDQLEVLLAKLRAAERPLEG